MKQLLILILISTATVAQAKTKVDVQFQDKTKATTCDASAAWKKDIAEAFKQQLIHAMNETGVFTIVEPELFRAETRDSFSGVNTVHKKRTFKAAQYSIEGAITAFDVCDVKKKQEAEVALEIRVLEVASGDVAHKFTAKGKASEIAARVDAGYKGAVFNSGLFRDAPIGQATQAAIRDAATRLKKAFPEREVASNGYMVKTIRKPRR
ncbi:MAG: hypothetical protein KF799_14715 [Bdellovibrionales bacterium]|nr:hypothetical protein [Bdellovibrionales bacterium]